MWYIHIVGYYSAIKNGIMPFVATGIDLDTIITKQSKSDRERKISHDIIYMRNLIKMMQKNVFTK